MRRTILVFLLLPASAALADGKFYGREEVPPGVPYQRALIAFDGERELLVLQSRYAAAAQAPEPAELGWVVPVPAVPELAALTWEEADRLFWVLDMRTLPAVVHLRLSAWILVLLLFALWIFGALRIPAPRKSPLPVLVTILFALLYAFLLLCLEGPTAGSSPGVEVLLARRVGAHDVAVVRAAEPGPLVDWLRTREFRFGAEDEAAFRDYVDRGFVFVTARIAPDAGRALGADGLADPLVLDFPVERAFYPLLLTGTAGHETEVLLYVLSAHRMTAGERLPLLFAGRIRPQEIPILRQQGLDLPWITKLKGRLGPADMREDLHLDPAPEDVSWRRTVWRW